MHKYNFYAAREAHRKILLLVGAAESSLVPHWAATSTRTAAHWKRAERPRHQNMTCIRLILLPEWGWCEEVALSLDAAAEMSSISRWPFCILGTGGANYKFLLPIDLDRNWLFSVFGHDLSLAKVTTIYSTPHQNCRELFGWLYDSGRGSDFNWHLEVTTRSVFWMRK